MKGRSDLSSLNQLTQVRFDRGRRMDGKAATMQQTPSESQEPWQAFLTPYLVNSSQPFWRMKGIVLTS